MLVQTTSEISHGPRFRWTCRMDGHRKRTFHRSLVDQHIVRVVLRCLYDGPNIMLHAIIPRLTLVELRIKNRRRIVAQLSSTA